MKETATYSVVLQCSNCGLRKDANIPVGTTIREYTIKQSCANCGCTTMHESHEPKFQRPKDIFLKEFPPNNANNKYLCTQSVFMNC